MQSKSAVKVSSQSQQSKSAVEVSSQSQQSNQQLKSTVEISNAVMLTFNTAG